jgi:hexosaminidase
MMNRYDEMGLNYAKSAFKVSAKTHFDEVKKQLAITLSSELSGVEIRYTIDGSEPTVQSPLYTEPVLLTKSSILKAIPIVNGVPVAKSISQSFNINKATVKPVKYVIPFNKHYKGSGDYSLVNGIRGTTNHSDGEWQGWEGSNMEVIIDLQQQTDISTVSVGALQNVGAWILFPKKVEFFVSEDGLKFQKVGEAINDADPLSGEKLLKNFSATFNPVKAGFVKVIAANFGKGPKGTMTEGKNVWLFVDEISVE